MTDTSLPDWLQALRNPALYPHRAAGFEVLETHISWVLLTGDYAYKFKKPVNFGFLDFSSLDKRAYYCAEELRLNRRLTPQLYVDVVAVHGTPSAPRLDGPGPAFEYAVKMREFPQTARLDAVLAGGGLGPALLHSLAARVADFHARVARAPADSAWGTPEAVYRPLAENFRVIREALGELDGLAALETWSAARFRELTPRLQARKQAGWVRECHGDMHLANMALLDGEAVLFDGIEFNEDFRWIDVASEIAFLIMDLDERGAPELGAAFLAAYLERGGDYAGLPLLRFYQVYRALVRAKVAALRLGQAGAAEHAALRATCQAYLALAQGYTRPARPFLLLAHGVSGSGKTTLARQLAGPLRAVHMRSDMERKRLFGIAYPGLYGADATQATYARLAELAGLALQAGFPVIVDATFLRAAQRAQFRDLAASLGAPFLILDMRADIDTLRARVARRRAEARDASDADLRVLAGQLAAQEPLAPAERAVALGLDSARLPEVEQIAAQVRMRLAG